MVRDWNHRRLGKMWVTQSGIDKESSSESVDAEYDQDITRWFLQCAYLHQYDDVKDCHCEANTSYTDIDGPFGPLDGKVCPEWGLRYLIKAASVSWLHSIEELIIY